jgi:hypothetical protein
MTLISFLPYLCHGGKKLCKCKQWALRLTEQASEKQSTMTDFNLKPYTCKQMSDYNFTPNI